MPRYLIAINPHDNYDPFVEIEATKRQMQWPSCERFASSASPQRTERHGSSEVMLRSGVYGTPLRQP
jgi:hypothetical protein